MRLPTAIAAGYREFKAILGTPVFTGPMPSYNGEALRLWDEITNGWAAVRAGFSAFWGALREWGGTDYRSLAASAAANPHAGRGLRLICDNGAAVPVIAYRQAAGPDGGDEEDPENAALMVIEKAGWEALWTPFVHGAYCDGQAFYRRFTRGTGPVDGRGQVIKVTPLRNERFVEVRRDAVGEPAVYVFSRRDGRGNEEIPAEEVLHVKLFNPDNEDRGLPILVSARRALTVVEEADVWNRSIARGGGRVPGYLKPSTLQPGQTYTPEQVRAAQQATDSAFAERKAVNLPMILSGAFDYVEGSVSPREADWLKGRQVAMREIAAVLGVPAALLSDEKGGSLTDAGVDSEVAALFKLTIQPLVTRLLAEFTAWLCGEGERLDADWDQIPALQEDMDKKFTRYTAASGPGKPLTKKEARVALGYDPDPAPEMVDEEPAVPPMLPGQQPPAQPGVPPGGMEDPIVKSLRDMAEAEYDRITMRLVA